MSRTRSTKTLVTFSGGVWSPEEEGRVDIDRSISALRKAENFIIEQYGSLRRRPGLRFVAPVKGYGGSETPPQD